jgi:O-antigen/teichoic acid export membrane protein
LTEGRPSLLEDLGRLASHSAVYGAADVFTTVVNLLLIPLYTTYLGAAEYGHLALLLLFSVLAKILFRLGLDAGFFRVHYEMTTDADRRRLAGTVALFALGAASLLLAVVVALRGPLTRALLGGGVPETWIVLAAADVYAGTFAFVPLALLRIQDRPRLFSALSVVRHTVNIALKVLLVSRGHGITGILWADLAATVAFAAALSPVLLRNAAPAFSMPLLREVLAFALPKVPHGLLVQALNLADRKILDVFSTRAEVGLYHMGYTFGGGVKFALSAFEPAWGPFVYSQAREAGGPSRLARIASWAYAAFAGAALAVAALGPDLLRLMTPRNPAFHAAAPIIPVIALAYLLHGVFLLTSIGIGIARAARYYPVVTAAAAAANVGANLALVPRFGAMGAAWATVLAYAVMAVLGHTLSRRVFPIPFEGGRIARLSAAAAIAYALAALVPGEGTAAASWRAAALSAYPVAAVILGAVGPDEVLRLRRIVGRKEPLTRRRST